MQSLKTSGVRWMKRQHHASLPRIAIHMTRVVSPYGLRREAEHHVAFVRAGRMKCLYRAMHFIPLGLRDTLKRELQRSARPFSLEFNL